MDGIRYVTSTLVLSMLLGALFVLSLWRQWVGPIFEKVVKAVQSTESLEMTPSLTELRSGSLHELQEVNIRENPYEKVLETHKLVPDLTFYYAQYNVDIQKYRITTADGFVLDLWRLVSRDAPTNSRYPLLLLHGLLQSCGAFASTGQKSLAYYLLVAGFDVWLGNNRCGLNPEWDKEKVCEVMQASRFERAKWDWDIEEMVKYDMRALIEFILNRVPYKKISLIAHSQGTTQGLHGLVNGLKIYDDDFQLIDKLDNFVALAPAIYPGPLINEKWFIRLMASCVDNPWLFGNKSFIPIMMTMRNLLVGTRLFSFLSYAMFNYMFDWSDALWDKSFRDRNFLFSPVHISVKLMQWWLSPDPSKTSFQYGAHKIFPDDKTWFPVDKNMSTITPHLNRSQQQPHDYPKILLFIPKKDRLVDGDRLIKHFEEYEHPDLYKIFSLRDYSHLDVLWAYDVTNKIGSLLLSNLKLSDGDA